MILTTDRLAIRRFTLDDAAFVLELVNEPSWIEFIGNKNVRSLDDARGYLTKGPLAMYERHGFGLWMVERKSDAMPMGMCGLIKRDTLDDVDIGFAFLPRHWGQGYAREAAAAVLAHAKGALGLARVVAITTPGNVSSMRVLEAIGLAFERVVRMGEPAEELRLYGIRL